MPDHPTAPVPGTTTTDVCADCGTPKMAQPLTPVFGTGPRVMTWCPKCLPQLNPTCRECGTAYDEGPSPDCETCNSPPAMDVPAPVSPSSEPTRRPDVLAEEARCESCGRGIASPTTGRIAGDCAFCGGRMVATKGAWSMTGDGFYQPVSPADPTRDTTQREEDDCAHINIRWDAELDLHHCPDCGDDFPYGAPSSGEATGGEPTTCADCGDEMGTVVQSDDRVCINADCDRFLSTSSPASSGSSPSTPPAAGEATTRTLSPMRDWVEDASHENGDYLNVCIHCREMFVGHKRRVACRLCATPAAEPPAVATDGEGEPLTDEERKAAMLAACVDVTSPNLRIREMALLLGRYEITLRRRLSESETARVAAEAERDEATANIKHLAEWATEAAEVRSRLATAERRIGELEAERDDWMGAAHIDAANARDLDERLRFATDALNLARSELAAMTHARDLWKQAHDDLLARHTSAHDDSRRQLQAVEQEVERLDTLAALVAKGNVAFYTDDDGDLTFARIGRVNAPIEALGICASVRGLIDDAAGRESPVAPDAANTRHDGGLASPALTASQAATAVRLANTVLFFTRKLSRGAACGGFLLPEAYYADVKRLAVAAVRAAQQEGRDGGSAGGDGAHG